MILEPRTVCIIDDDEEIIDLVDLILAPQGYVVKGATNGRDGLALVAREQPAVVLLDVMMPDMDGWQVLEALRKAEATQEVPIVLLSGAKASNEVRLSGVDGVIVKPFGPTDLIEGLTRVLGA